MLRTSSWEELDSDAGAPEAIPTVRVRLQVARSAGDEAAVLFGRARATAFRPGSIPVTAAPVLVDMSNNKIPLSYFTVLCGPRSASVVERYCQVFPKASAQARVCRHLLAHLLAPRGAPIPELPSVYNDDPAADVFRYSNESEFFPMPDSTADPDGALYCQGARSGLLFGVAVAAQQLRINPLQAAVARELIPAAIREAQLPPVVEMAPAAASRRDTPKKADMAPLADAASRLRGSLGLRGREAFGDYSQAQVVELVKFFRSTLTLNADGRLGTHSRPATLSLTQSVAQPLPKELAREIRRNANAPLSHSGSVDRVDETSSHIDPFDTAATALHGGSASRRGSGGAAVVNLDARDDWEPDDGATNCPSCGTQFGNAALAQLFGSATRSHCRVCRRVFCKTCTRYEVTYLTGGTKFHERDDRWHLRCCEACYKSSDRRVQVSCIQTLLCESGVSIATVGLLQLANPIWFEAARRVLREYRRMFFTFDPPNATQRQLLIASAGVIAGHPQQLVKYFSAVNWADAADAGRAWEILKATIPVLNGVGVPSGFPAHPHFRLTCRRACSDPMPDLVAIQLLQTLHTARETQRAGADSAKSNDPVGPVSDSRMALSDLLVDWTLIPSPPDALKLRDERRRAAAATSPPPEEVMRTPDVERRTCWIPVLIDLLECCANRHEAQQSKKALRDIILRLCKDCPPVQMVANRECIARRNVTSDQYHINALHEELRAQIRDCDPVASMNTFCAALEQVGKRGVALPDAAEQAAKQAADLLTSELRKTGGTTTGRDQSPPLLDAVGSRAVCWYRPFNYMFDPSIKIVGVDLHGLRVMSSKVRPWRIPLIPETARSPADFLPVLFKVEDVRRDYVACNVFATIDSFLTRNGQLRQRVCRYRVLPLTESSGLIEMVGDSQTVGNLSLILGRDDTQQTSPMAPDLASAPFLHRSGTDGPHGDGGGAGPFITNGSFAAMVAGPSVSPHPSPITTWLESRLGRRGDLPIVPRADRGACCGSPTQQGSPPRSRHRPSDTHAHGGRAAEVAGHTTGRVNNHGSAPGSRNGSIVSPHESIGDGALHLLASVCLDDEAAFFAPLPTVETREALCELFVASVQFYAVVTYLLAVGDRHPRNVLLRRDGSLCHIDFGFLLGEEPGHVMSTAFIRYDSDTKQALVTALAYLEALRKLRTAAGDRQAGSTFASGDEEKLNSTAADLASSAHQRLIDGFWQAAGDMFVSIRPHADAVLMLLTHLVDIKSVEKAQVTTSLVDRLLLEHSDAEARRIFVERIDQSFGSKRTCDTLHEIARVGRDEGYMAAAGASVQAISGAAVSSIASFVRAYPRN